MVKFVEVGLGHRGAVIPGGGPDPDIRNQRTRTNSSWMRLDRLAMSTLNLQPTFLSETSSQDLWTQALNTLDDELRNTLHLTTVSRNNVLSIVLKEAWDKKKLCTQKCWKFKKRNGEIIIVRDVIEKIIVWLEKFVAVGDIVIQYDPVAVNDKRVLGDTIENLETVSHLITRYAITERLFLQRNSPARDQLQETTVRLYAEILIFLAKTRKYFQSSAKDLVRLAKSVINFSEDEHVARLKTLDSQLSKLLEVFTIDIQIDTAKEIASMQRLLTSLDQPVQRMIDHSGIAAQAVREREHLQLLHWLSCVPFSSHNKRHSQNRIHGSGQWLLDHDQYVNWRNTSSSSVFLLHGVLGSGKTSLASVVVDAFLGESSAHNSSAPVAYFYCTKNSAEPERSDPDEIMRCILKQLTVCVGPSSTIHERVLREFEHRQAEAKVDGFELRRLQTAECVRLILDTISSNPATIVLDAIDEIHSSSRHILLSALDHIVRESLNIVKVFVTSRDDSNIHALLPDAINMRIQERYIKRDMEEFVQREVSSSIQNRRMLNGAVSDGLKQAVTNALITGAGDMFVWAGRQLENLCHLKTEVDIRDAMRTLPKHTLQDIYEADFTQMSAAGQHTRRSAVQVFALLLCAQEALSPEAVIQALAKTLPEQREITTSALFDICLNLVVLDTELNTLRFAHASFQEFLATKEEFAPCNVHKIASISCLDTCLEGLPIKVDEKLSPKDDFYHYSTLYWPEHCKLSMIEGDEDSVANKMREFVFDEGDVALTFDAWMDDISKLTKNMRNDHPLARELYAITHTGGSPLFTACVFGLMPILEDLAIATDYDWNQTNDLEQSGLYLAAAAGHEVVVRHLLRHQINVNTVCGGKFGYALHAACFGGHLNVVKLLLDTGAEAKIGRRNALECALLANHENIALLLLDGKFGISNQAEYDSNFQQAAEAGFTEVLQFLQKKYTSLYGEFGSSRCKAVQFAIFNGRIGVVERYRLKLQDRSKGLPKDAVATAALGGQGKMIEYLKEKGLDLNQEGILGTPLRSASIMGHESTVRLLLGLGACIQTSGSFGAPLQAAAMRGHLSITTTLLSHGADVNSQGGLFGTALQAAAHRGHIKIVEILLNAGADVHRDGFSPDALHAATEGGHGEIVRLLLEKGFSAKQPAPHMHLRHTALSSYTNLLRDASPSRSVNRKPTPTQQPASQESLERTSLTEPSCIIQMMRGTMSSDSDMMQSVHHRTGRLDSHNDKGHYLRSAAAKGHNSVVELLLCHLDDLNISESQIIAAFNKACENGHEKVVNQLLSHHVGADDFQAALHAAASRGHLNIVVLLINHEERLGVARMLSESCGEPWGTYEYDSTAYTILDAASSGGHLPVFKRGQDLVAQRCTEVASRHLYRKALSTSAAKGPVVVLEAVLECLPEISLEELTNTLELICAWGTEEALLMVLKQDTKKVLGVQQYSDCLKHACRNHNRALVIYWLETHPERQSIVIEPATVIDVSANGFMDILPLLIEHIRPTISFKKTINQCLQVASEGGLEDTVRYLIDESADINIAVEEISHLYYRCHYGKVQSARELTALEAALIGFERLRADFDRSTWTRADIESQEQCIDVLLAKGANANGTSQSDRRPLHIAAACCPPEIVRKLLKAGACVEAETKALEAAASREIGCLPIIEALLGASRPVSPTDSSVAAALDKALSFFECSNEFYIPSLNRDFGRFQSSASIADVICNGPGAVVTMLLAHLSNEKANDARYGLLLQMACMLGDEECVVLLLQRNIDVNSTGYYYGTALQAASRVGNISIVEKLLRYGAQVNITYGAHGTALRAAVLGGHENVVRRLIACGADVNLRHEYRGNTVLHLALESRSQAIFQALLIAGADVSTNTSDQQHVLITACKKGDTAIVQLLLAIGVDVNLMANVSYDEVTPLHAACAAGHSAIIRLLLDHGGAASIEVTNGWSATPLIAAIRGNHSSAVRLLLDAHADVNHATPCTPLWEAADDDRSEIVEQLLSAGAIVGGPLANNAHINALSKACRYRHFEVIQLLLEKLSGSLYEADICSEASSTLMEDLSLFKERDSEMICLLMERVSTPSFNLLRQACSVGVLEALEILLSTGLEVNSDDGIDAPLLHVAASHSQPDVVRFLISHGANVRLRSPKYGNPVMAALEGCLGPFFLSRSHPESCRSLAKKLPLSTTDPRLKEIVFWNGAPRKPEGKDVRQCEQIVQNLVEVGAEVDSSIRDFGHALHLASYMGSQVIVRLLLQRMENIHVLGGYFISPLIAAIEGDHPAIVRLLLDHGVKVDRTAFVQYASGHEENRDSPFAIALSLNGPSSMQSRGTGTGILMLEQQQVVDMLLGFRPKIQVTERDLLAALEADNYNFRDHKNFVGRFLAHDESAIVTEAVIIKAIHMASSENLSIKTLALLLKHDAGLGTTPAMLKATRRVEVMRLLLEHTPQCQLTANTVLELIRRVWRNRSDILYVFLEYGKTLEDTPELRDYLEEEIQSYNDQELKDLFNKLEKRH
ncbi:MAG: hypothetical protein Q9181_002565 [Wetmoreana brouardii]